ncbi:bifunctional (p)ppGpp synthetase/guanosine-3',5'-bis(diphosphate) 3'-pyrophosphohydrolase [Bdellovibrio sp. KM01]|uniref:RelA/SpoT family protein n=1 Tax=Bdellovibrio sp. KM01 TaxID=2748865 RepID=UPI0015E97F29|nr:bifunctional (p)ppGpp synthetase/guanosine-3',5'-bis(diphosphate) 3'-pyrophosphohydrolase [Bdellovibrio sp. KM01]QLY26868.1 bifunctional (p)ppGpp synthetase/guanosine-3',5'-bis(diphosphate) 3'-pyrophosphohydrolase [Bdellovibrio sp. KM01]
MAEPQKETGLSHKPVKTVDDLLNRIRSYWPNADLKFIEKAYYFSEKHHEGQIRRSGEPYISHPLSVAAILADLRLDLDTIATGLLHDTVEDTDATLEDIRREFGDAVAHLVDGVTKIGQMKFKNSHEKQGENIRKMIVAMGKDVRVVLVKLADRLHNMRTLNFMPFDKQEKIALETLEIYCPLAGRMGISALKIELEDLCFRYYRPDMYYELIQQVKKTEAEQNRYIEDVKHLISKELSKVGFKFEVYGRSKHLWSVYRKMQSRNLDYDQVYDVLAFRVIVESVAECYAALGLVHSLWKPVPGRFKDFIAMPKTNNYQSLHTTVVGPGGERIEIQIRTSEMHLIAEMGIAAHWKYKERGKMESDEMQQANWLRDLVSWHQQVRSPDEFLDTVKTDLFETEIYVFTPTGEVREFPEGATPVDFAYAVHTELGNKCVGARVNGKMVPLKHQLSNGDTVEIITGKGQEPSKDWLKFVVTNKAKAKIRAFVKEEQRRRSILLGKELVEKEFRKFGMAAVKYLKGPAFEQYLKDFGLKDVEELYVTVGYGKLETRVLVERLSPENIAKEAAKTEDSTFMERVMRAATHKTRKTNSLVSVDGMDDMLVHYAKCCHPIPGDPIVGFISRGRGITIHRSDCSKAFEFDQLRKVDVAWNVKVAGEGQERIVRLKIISQDNPGLLKSMSEAFAQQGINIQSAQIRTTKDKKAVCNFEVSVKDALQLNQAIYEIQKIKGIIGVTRVIQ